MELLCTQLITDIGCVDTRLWHVLAFSLSAEVRPAFCKEYIASCLQLLEGGEMAYTILLADDSITIQKVLELTFVDEDFELHAVGNGQQAIDEIRTVKPDIALCDIIMPGKNGYEVCEYIKRNDDLRHIPVLLLTSAFESLDKERANIVGYDGCLEKPFDPQTLLSKVRELLLQTSSAQSTERLPMPTKLVKPFDPTDGNATVMIDGSQVQRSDRQLSSQMSPPFSKVPLEHGCVEEAEKGELLMESGDQAVVFDFKDALVSAAPVAENKAKLTDIGGVSSLGAESKKNRADEMVERIALRVIEKLSDKVIKEIAREIIPDLAEGLIRKEIEALKSQAEE